jgi:hypothetical protein
VTGLDEFDSWWRISTRALLIVNREAARQLRNGGDRELVQLRRRRVLADLRDLGGDRDRYRALTRALALEMRARHHRQRGVARGRPTVHPDRVADVVVHLLSSEGGGFTGHVVRVDEANR